jgi:hypothetical protein
VSSMLVLPLCADWLRLPSFGHSVGHMVSYRQTPFPGRRQAMSTLVSASARVWGRSFPACSGAGEQNRLLPSRARSGELKSRLLFSKTGTIGICGWLADGYRSS